MLRPAITQLISKNDSYYSLVIGIAKRARQISDELLEEKKTLEEKPVKTAVEEFANGKFKIVEAPQDVEETQEENEPAEQTAVEAAEPAEAAEKEDILNDAPEAAGADQAETDAQPTAGAMTPPQMF